jgi:hypothetical protein
VKYRNARSDVTVGSGAYLERSVLGAFAKLRKATVSSVTSVRLCEWNSSAPNGRILMKFDISAFLENLYKVRVTLKCEKNNVKVLYWRINTHFWSYLVQFLLEWKMFLANLTLMDPCIVNVFLSITNKMQRYTMYLFLWNAVHVSGGSSAHHQELKTVYTVSGTCQSWLLPEFQLFHDNDRQQ